MASRIDLALIYSTHTTYIPLWPRTWTGSGFPDLYKTTSPVTDPTTIVWLLMKSTGNMHEFESVPTVDVTFLDFRLSQ
jgi:hypothetical protein